MRHGAEERNSADRSEHNPPRSQHRAHPEMDAPVVSAHRTRSAAMFVVRASLVLLTAMGSGAGAQCPATRFATSDASWPVWGRDASNTRHQPAAAAGVSASNVSRLKLRWAFNLGSITEARVQPTVAGGTVFIA